MVAARRGADEHGWGQMGWFGGKDDAFDQAMASAAKAGQDWLSVQSAAKAFIAANPVLANDPNLRNLFPGLHNSMVVLAVAFCGIDQPISDEATRIINVAAGDTGSVGSYNFMRQANLDAGIDSAFSLLRVLMQILANEEIQRTSNFDPSENPVIRAVEAVAQACFMVDARISPAEAHGLGVFTSRLREQAAKLRAEFDRKIAEAEAGATAPDPAPAPLPAAPAEGADPDTLAKALADLHALIGLSSVKTEVETLANLAKMFGLRRDRGLPTPEMSFHVVFTGNPGTGKTTVARILSRIYHHLGLVSKGHLVEVDRSGLVASFVGQTAPKVKAAVDRATGGVLFIDEAYALAGGGENDYGSEAIETLLKLMEDRRDDLAVIAAGYTDRMAGFLASNPGLKSRFPKTIVFPDYTAEEMLAIFSSMALAMRYRLDASAQERLASVFSGLVANKGVDFANAREVRNIFERVMSMQANRISALPDVTEAALLTITLDDVDLACGSKAPA